jgi:site-specific DNA-adenine methylase
MFSYYGAKTRLADLYPSPRHTKIIEPFAGSARYSLKYFDRDVLLVDKYRPIIDVWHYLQQASENDIRSLPRLKRGMNLDALGLSGSEKLLVGFMAGIGHGRPSKTVSPFAAVHFGEDRRSKWETMAEQLHKIRHWKIICGDYQDIENETATWFIDPPYQHGGQFEYKFSNKYLDFAELGQWCKSRKGQVIVCENTKADWLPFYPMRGLHGINSDTVEAIWCNHEHDYMARQAPLFSQVQP